MERCTSSINPTSPLQTQSSFRDMEGIRKRPSVDARASTTVIKRDIHNFSRFSFSKVLEEIVQLRFLKLSQICKLTAYFDHL
jgi:hypothetical protein